MVFTTPEIVEEYGGPLPGWVSVQPVQNKKLLQTYRKRIDRGEASAIALAREIHADLVILDDKAARKFAQRLDLALKGTLGLLAMAQFPYCSVTD